MTRLIVTTNHREMPASESSGWIFIVDLEQQKVLKQTSGLEPPYRALDLNPRGGMRGMRGLSFYNGELAVADYSSVFFFSEHWKLLRTITHPSVSGIHEIVYTDGGVWVTSTINDILARLDLEGNLTELHYLREQKHIMRQVKGSQKIVLQSKDLLDGKVDFRGYPQVKSKFYDGMHLNSLAISPDNRIILSLGLTFEGLYHPLMTMKTIMRKLSLWDLFLSVNRFIRRIFGFKKRMLSELVIQPDQGRSAIVSMDQSGKWNVHLQFPVTHNPSHSVRIMDDGTCLYLNSSQGSFVHFDLSGEILSSNKITDKFLRGLLVLPNGQFVAGADNTLIVYDLYAQKTVSEFELSEDSRNSVFDITIFPPEFELPPSSLQEKVGRMIGFKGQTIIWEDGANENPNLHP